MATTTRNLKIKTSTCKRIVKELHSYEKEVETEIAKTADMKDKGADPYYLKQQENVLAEFRMMIPDCQKRLEAALADLKAVNDVVHYKQGVGTIYHCPPHCCQQVLPLMIDGECDSD